MEVEEILRVLAYPGEYFPYEAVQEAIAKKEEITPHLLQILEDTTTNIQRVREDGSYWGPIFAMFLLAQFREKRAYPLIVDIFSQPGETPFEIANDFVTEDLDRVLASVCNGDTTLIKGIIENSEINEYVRAAGISALVILVVNGILSREEVIEYFRSLFKGKIERKPSIIWMSLVMESSNLAVSELYGDIVVAYEEGLIEDKHFVPLSIEEDYLFANWEENLEELKRDSHYQLINDTIKEMEWWACWKGTWEKWKKLVGEEEKEEKQAKVGRNDSCPCGSGKKYKKCCGALAKKDVEHGFCP